jgi:hypothetical protein
MCSAGKIKEGNFEHLYNFDAILKILQIFSLTFFSLKAKGSLLLEVAKSFTMVLWQYHAKWLDFFVFKITRTTADFEQYFVFYIQYKSELQHQGVISSTFRVIKKQEGALTNSGHKKL